MPRHMKVDDARVWRIQRWPLGLLLITMAGNAAFADEPAPRGLYIVMGFGLIFWMLALRDRAKG